MKKLSICLMLAALTGCVTIMDKFNDGASSAQKAASAYAQGDAVLARIHADNALKTNPNQDLALLVAGLSAEASANPNQAKAFYERIIILSPNTTTLLTSADFKPVKLVDIAHKRLRGLEIKSSEIIVEDYDGQKTFNIKENVAKQQNKNAIEEALFQKHTKEAISAKQNTDANIKAADVLFDGGQEHVVTRFVILKELAENGLITKEEFLNARTANLGAILPLTNDAPGYGLDKPVPSAENIIERINVLKEGVAETSISSQEFLAERTAIVNGVMSSNPKVKAAKTLPQKDILGAAKALRKLEVLDQLNLITKAEKESEAAAIEKYLGLNYQAKEITKLTPEPVAITEPEKETKTETKEKLEEASAPEDINTKAPESIINTDLTKINVSEIEKILEDNNVPSTPEVPSPF